MLPEGWSRLEFGNIATFASGNTPSRQRPEFWGGGYPWVSGKDLKTHRIDSSIDTLSRAGYEHGKIARRGSSLVLVRGMTLLKKFPVGYATRDVAFNQDIKAIVAKNGLDPLFLSYALLANSHKIRQLVTIAGHGTGRLETELLKSYPIDTPNLAEQEKIADILSTWDQAIETTKKLIENSKAQKKALMQQLHTGKKRLPGFRDEWQEFRLGQLFSERKESNRLDLPLLSITQNRGVIYRDDVGRKDTSSKDKTKYKRLCPDDIGYNTMRMWQGVSALSDKEGIVSPAYTIATPNRISHPRYMAYLFKQPKTVHSFYRYSQGLVSDTWNLKFPNFSEVKVTIPAQPEQEAIADILQTADSEIEKLTQHLDNLRCQKKALMQQLLTGKRRVKVAA